MPFTGGRDFTQDAIFSEASRVGNAPCRYKCSNRGEKRLIFAADFDANENVHPSGQKKLTPSQLLASPTRSTHAVPLRKGVITHLLVSGSQRATAQGYVGLGPGQLISTGMRKVGSCAKSEMGHVNTSVLININAARQRRILICASESSFRWN